MDSSVPCCIPIPRGVLTITGAIDEIVTYLTGEPPRQDGLTKFDHQLENNCVQPSLDSCPILPGGCLELGVLYVLGRVTCLICAPIVCAPTERRLDTTGLEISAATGSAPATDNVQRSKTE